MNKPDSYAYYSNKNNNVSYSQWPKECKDWKNYLRTIRRHPEWKGLSDDEIQKRSRKLRAATAKKNHKIYEEKLAKMSPEELAAENAKKGNGWKNLSEEERKKKSEHMRQISLDFWNGMTEEERNEFSKYRWNLKTEEEKQIIIQRFNQAGIDRMRSLPKEEIDRQIAYMNKCYKEKWDNDENFRIEQTLLLRQHNMEFFDSMSRNEKREFYQDNGDRLGKYWIDKWNNDPDFVDKQTEFLASISHLGAAEIKRKWKEDPKFRKEQEIMLTQARINYYNSTTTKERYQMLGHNKLNIKFENRFKESILSKDYYIMPEYMYSIKNDQKFWDYAIYTKKNNELVMVVDLDGKFFHADTSDYNGLHSQEEYDERRSLFIDENVKVVIIDENKFNEGWKEMMDLLLIDYKSYINNLFVLYRSSEFPFPNYNHDELIKSFKQLLRMNPDNKYINLNIRNREGDRLITHFHHSIYKANTKGKPSPYDAWYNDDLLRRCIENRVLYRSFLNPNKVLQGFNISKIAPKVSVFSAGRAKLLIHKYLNQFDEIFDPFSGFSGRMLGAMSMYKKYIGQDISGLHINESLRMIDFLKRCKNNFPEIIIPDLDCKDILQSYGEYQCLFTCPPYNDKEQWVNIKPDKRTCDDWIDECLKRFKCKRYLFVVDDTKRYDENIVDVIINRSHLNQNSEYVILIDR